MPRTRLTTTLPAVAGLVLALGCAPSGGEAGAAATDLFVVARSADPESGRASDLFVAPPRGAARAKLYDVLEELARVEDPRVVAVEPIDGPDRVAVDILGSPASGAVARYSVHLVRRDGAFRVEWIGGPALRWPARPTAARESGLSSSHAEGGPDRAW
jgi:hypothetical protein